MEIKKVNCAGSARNHSLQSIVHDEKQGQIELDNAQVRRIEKNTMKGYWKTILIDTESNEYKLCHGRYDCDCHIYQMI